MTAAEKKRIEWHLNVPCCETLAGVREHVGHISLADWWLLARYFDCESIFEAIRPYWHAVKENRKGKRSA